MALRARRWMTNLVLLLVLVPNAERIEYEKTRYEYEDDLRFHACDVGRMSARVRLESLTL